MIKVSVIVPVYKVEKFLTRCLNSVLKQTLKDIEIILIYDPISNDRCPDICEEFSKKDKRIIKVYQKNSGLSAARNAGMKVASGKYFSFVDSDDFIYYGDALENLHTAGEEAQADMVIGGYYYKEKEKIALPEKPRTNKSGIDYFYWQVKHKTTLNTVWAKLYKKQLLIENDLKFKEGMLHEDDLFTPQVLFYAKKVGILQKPVYYYENDNIDSLTHLNDIKKTQKSFMDSFENINEVIDFFKNKEFDIKIKKYLLRKYIYIPYRLALKNYWLLYQNDESLEKKMKTMENFMDSYTEKKLSIKKHTPYDFINFYRIMHLFGFKRLATLTKPIFNLKHKLVG